MCLRKYKYKLKYIIISSLIIIFILLLSGEFYRCNYNKISDYSGKRIGIIGFYPNINIGNNLIKYSMYAFLKKYGFKPILISLKTHYNIYFLRKYVNIKEIENFSVLNESDYDILIVNSDQCWLYKLETKRAILDMGFLSFAKNWNIKKFVYAASLGHSYWNISDSDLISARELAKQFSGISVREQASIEIIKNKLDIEPDFVLDPTFLLEKTDYLQLIKNFSIEIDLKENYLCVYLLDKSENISNYINKIAQELKYNILYLTPFSKNYIENFLYSINICKSIITDSFHGTVFSIIFEKPFLSFVNTNRGNSRFFSLNQTFDLYNRIIYPKKFEKKDIDILTNKLIINKTKFYELKKYSIMFLKKNLGLIK